MHIELRVRTVCELVFNDAHYLKPDVTSFLSGNVGEGESRKQPSAPGIHACTYC